MTQLQLAQRMGVTKSVVSFYELQERTPSPDILVTQQARRAAEEPREDNLVQGDEREKLSRQRQRNALETQLRHAVETENFEEAAKLRDQLRSLPQA